MSQDYNNGYNLDNLKKLLNFKGVVKKDNLDEKLVKIFNFFDANHNGQLESNELTQILNQVTQYGASRNKSIFDKQEATSFVNSYKNAQNKTLKQLGVNADNLYQFLDNVKNNVNKQTTNKKVTMNLEVTGLNTYRELAQWLFRQEGKKPSETELQKRTNELINLNKNSNPPIQNGKLKGNYVKISISQKGINNVSKYITKQAFKAISGMNWNASGIKKIQKMFDKGEINRYDIVEFLDNFNHKKDKDGNVISETQQGDTSIIDAIISETEWGNNSNKIKLLTSIIENVYWAAIDAGVPKATVSKLTAEYKKEMNKQMKFFEGTGVASADAQGMENALNSLIGQIKVARLGVKTKTDYSRAERFAQDNKSAVSGDITNNNAIQTAKEFYNIVDNNSGSTSMQKLKALVYNPKKFNYKNVVDVITAYNQTGIRQGDTDIIDSILSESHTNKAPTVNHQNKTYIANGEAYDVINKILNTLKQSAKEKGVPDRFLTEARTEWAKEMYKLKVSKTSKLEENEVHMKYINKLIDLIGGKNVGATGAYADGRASDSWVGIGADKVFGLFGCKTMSEMEAKLGNQAQNAKDLVNFANHIKSAKTNAEKSKFMQQFKVKYKAIFGVDYNPQVMAAREKLQDKVAQVQINKSLQPVFNKALGAKDISSMKKAVEDCKIVMGKDDKTKKNIYLADIINMQVEAYMQAKAPQGLILSNPNEYNKMYSEIYKNIVSNMKAEYQKTAKEAIGNSSYEQMQIDMEQLNQAAYGTTNIGKEVAKFNQNQAMTQQYSELALDIGATIATCWIPGLGEAAGLKMVATFGKLAQSATKMAKFYKALDTAGKTLYKSSKFVKGIQTTSAIGKMEQVGDKTVRTIKVGQKTVQLGKVTNFALESAVSGAYNMINTGATITTLHGLEHFNKNQNWKANWEAGKGMAIFGGVSAVGGFAGKLASQIASKMGISSEIAQKSLAFVVSEGANFGYANAETVMAYVKEKQKTDPSFNFSKMSTKELWEVICSDENLINNVIMATMTTVTHITQRMGDKSTKVSTKFQNTREFNIKLKEISDRFEKIKSKDTNKRNIEKYDNNAKQTLLEIAQMDVEVANAILDRYTNISFLPEIKKATEIDANLTKKILTMSYKQTLKEKLKGEKNYLYSFNSGDTILSTVQAIKKAPELQRYLTPEKVQIIFQAKPLIEEYGTGLLYKNYEDLNINDKYSLLKGLLAERGVQNSPLQRELLKDVKDMYPCLEPCCKNGEQNPKYIETIKKLYVDIYKKDYNFSEKFVKEFNLSIENLNNTSNYSNMINYINQILNKINIKLSSKEVELVLKEISNNKSFQNLSKSEQKVWVFTKLLKSNNSEGLKEVSKNLFKQLGFSTQEISSIKHVLSSFELLEQRKLCNKKENIEQLDYQIAFELKNGKDFNIANQIYGIEKNNTLFNNLKKVITEIKSNDFSLPQTTKNDYLSKAHEETLNVNGNIYKVKVVKMADLSEFNTYIHSIRGTSSQGASALDYSALLEKYKFFDKTNDNNVFCVSYINKENIGVAKPYNGFACGLMFEVPTEKQYVGAGYDIGSFARDTKQLLKQYYVSKTPIQEQVGWQLHKNVEGKYLRELVSKNLKEIMNISDDVYIQRWNNIYKQLGDKTLTIENLEKIDKDMANAYKTFLSRSNSAQDFNDNCILRNRKGNDDSQQVWNEFLVGNPTISGIYMDTQNIKGYKPSEGSDFEKWIKFAEENDIPIVLLK